MSPLMNPSDSGCDTPASGGPAFPVTFNHDRNVIGTSQEWEGMSLRDWFAGQALAGLLAQPCDWNLSSAAISAYQYADAMLEARKTPK